MELARALNIPDHITASIAQAADREDAVSDALYYARRLNRLQPANLRYALIQTGQNGIAFGKALGISENTLAANFNANKLPGYLMALMILEDLLYSQRISDPQKLNEAIRTMPSVTRFIKDRQAWSRRQTRWLNISEMNDQELDDQFRQMLVRFVESI